MVDSEQLYRRERELEETVHELEGSEDDLRGKLDRLEGYSARLLNLFGVSGRKADFIYAVLGLEEDSRVESVDLSNLDTITARVYLNKPFKNIGSMQSYLEKRGIDPCGTINRDGENYLLDQVGLGVTVYFSPKDNSK